MFRFNIIISVSITENWRRYVRSLREIICALGCGLEKDDHRNLCAVTKRLLCFPLQLRLLRHFTKISCVDNDDDGEESVFLIITRNIQPWLEYQSVSHHIACKYDSCILPYTLSF